MMCFICRILLLPIYPNLSRNGNQRKRSLVTIVSTLLFSHALAVSIVLFGVLSAVHGAYITTIFVKWSILTIFITFGLLASLVLLISRCRIRLPTGTQVQERDPSLNLQLVFLWIFGLANMIHFCINLSIYLGCMAKTQNDSGHYSFMIFVNIIYVMFTIFQMTFITYNRNEQLQRMYHLRVSCVFILLANFSIWYSSTVNNMFANGYVTEERNRSCFHNSEIERKLGSRISPILLPPQLEFCILASTLLMSLWENPKESQTSRNTFAFDTADHTQPQSTLPQNESIAFSHILALIFGILINVPILVSTVVLTYVYNWENKTAILVLDISESLSALCTCIIVFVCCRYLNVNCVYRTKPLTTREQILIFSSTGIMAYFTLGLLAGLSGFTFRKSTIVSRIFGMLETFLQTLFFIKSARYEMERSEQRVISCCGLMLAVTNLMYWLQDSYNRNIITKTRYLGYMDWNTVELTLVPLMIFYRFFSGISAYVMYKTFAPPSLH